MSDGLAAARRALAGRSAWLVGGPVRDALLGRPVTDVDVTVEGDVEAAARAVAAEARAAVFPLSEAFGAWRVTPRGAAWQVDLSPLRGGSIEADLGRRDFTINAMARPLGGGGGPPEGPAAEGQPAGALVDPFGGAADLAARRLRMVSTDALAADPLRTLRAARLACELDLEVDRDTVAAVRERAPALASVAAERVFAELRRIVLASAAVRGVRLAEELGVAEVVLPELARMEGVGQGIYHHLDVHEHTLAVLEAVVALEEDPEALLGPGADAADAHLSAQVGDGFTGWGALRLAALLHDAAKPDTRTVFPGDRVGFPGHDVQGAELVLAILRRLRTSGRLRVHVAALTRHHLRLGFLVHEAPLDRRALDAYFRATEPVSVDVTVFTVADRVATRGRKADQAIARHMELAREVLACAPEWEAARRAPPLVRGDEVARELGISGGPRLGRALEELRTARFAGEVSTPEEALAHLRRWDSR